MRKRTSLLPVLVAVLLTFGATAAHADTFILTLQDLTVGAPAPQTVVVIDNGAGGDTNGLVDHIVFNDDVGNFFVSVTGDVFFSTDVPPLTTAPVQMNLLNFLITSQSAGQFRATLTRTGLDAPVIGPVVGVAEYSATFDPGVSGSVTFQSEIDAGAESRLVFGAGGVTTTGSTGPTTVMSLPINLTGDFDLISTLDFTFTSGGSMTAQTDLQVQNAAVPEPTTLLLFGPGMLGLAALRRRIRSKAQAL